MVTQSIIELARHVGVELSQRHALGSYVYDGQSIALRRDDTFEYLDHEVLHEVCHWMVAMPEARSLPDFGLSVGVADTLASGGDGHLTVMLNEYKLYTKGEHGRQLPDGGKLYVSKVEEYEQEMATQVMCAYIGSRLNIDPMIRTFDPETGVGAPGEARTWDEYAVSVAQRLSPDGDREAATCMWMTRMNTESGVKLFEHTYGEHARGGCLELARVVGHRAMRTIAMYKQAIAAAMR